MTKGESPETVEQAAEWYFRRDGGRLSLAEEAEFQQWLDASPANRAAYGEIDTTWQVLAHIPRPAAEVSASRQRRTSFIPSGWSRLAAAAVALLALGYAFDLPMRLSADGYTGTGDRLTLTLDDGSSVVLNTNSAVAVNYTADVRRIHLLRGEAAFTVAKDPARPFLVDAAGGEAQALGTAFVVRTEQDRARVTVLESRVGVAYPQGAPISAELLPDQEVELSTRGVGPVHAVDAEAATAWRRGKLIFVDRPLGSVVDELNRYHTGRIQIADASISGHLVSGVFDVTDPVGVVDALENSLGLRSTRLTSLVILLHR